MLRLLVASARSPVHSRRHGIGDIADANADPFGRRSSHRPMEEREMTQTLTRQRHAGGRRATTVSLAAGALVLLGLGGAAAVGAAGDGYVSLGAGGTYATAGYALTTDSTNWRTELGHAIEQVRIRVTPDGDGRPIFAGVADTATVSRYLTGVHYTTVHNGDTRTEHDGTAPLPAATVPWTATGTTVQFPASAGEQTLVVMNADGSPSVRGRVDSVEVTVRGIAWIATGLLIAGLLLLAAVVARLRGRAR